MKKYCGILVFALLFLAPGRGAWAVVETMAEYSDTPIFMTNTVTPNVLIIMDNSGSMNDLAYPDAYDSTKTYFGYFTSTYKYTYSGSGYFYIDAAGTWSGNFLNWACMRRIDVGRKVLVGGKATSRTGGGNARLIGDDGNGWWVWKYGPTSGTAGVTPYSNAAGKKLTYELSNGYLYVYEYTTAQNPDVDSGTQKDKLTIKVQKDITLEASEFDSNGNLAGIMQRVSTKARWGIEFFNNSGCGAAEGCNSGRDGGNVAQPIVGTGYGTNFITDVENTAATSWTPLAESLYEAAGYFAQESTINGSTVRYNNGDYSIQASKDPLYFSELGQYVPCAKNFVLMITDGDPTMDTNIPGYIKDFDADSQDPVGTYAGSYGTDYLDDVALWAHTTDLRPTGGSSPLAGTQVLTLYTVYAFGSSATASTLLKNAAKNGAFIDSNGNSLPDLQSEWASLGRKINGVVVPDTYYEASDGAALETELMAAITDILKRASSGTAISVLATSGSGAGNIFQAYFLPAKTIVETSGARDVKWMGHLISLNIDNVGALRDKDNTCINFSFDTGQNQTLINNLSETAGVCGTTVTASTPLITYTNYNWDAGETLLTATPDSRKIFTFLDENRNGIVDSNQNGTLDTGEVYQFTTGNALRLSRYLRTSKVQVPPYTDSLNIINWVRGTAVTSGGVSVATPFRDRTMNSTKPTEQWKLGDIVHSTPTVVGPPAEAYGLLYQDSGYNTFYNTQVARINASAIKDVVFIGANDGMLHAFNASTGAELWAYIPYNLLAHLKWLTDPNYTHVDYVDMKTKVTDVNFGTTAAPNWKTVIIGGMRFGGGEISDESYDVDGDTDNPATKIRKYRSAFFCIDITDPVTPKVLWEFGHTLADYGLNANDLGFSMTYPAIVKVGDKFFAVVGTGPKASYVPDYQGAFSGIAAKVFVFDIKATTSAQLTPTTFTVPDTNSWFSDPIAVDIDFSTQNKVMSGGAQIATSYNTDAVYIGETYYTSSGGGYWAGRMWRLVTNGDVSPANWKFGRLYDTVNTAHYQSITSAPSASSDDKGNLWIFFGTGKYLSASDKTDGNTQSFYGIKDPCWTASTLAWDAACLTSSAATVSVGLANLLNVSGTNVYTTGTTSGGTTGATTFTGLESLVSAKMGWYMNLTASTTAVSEKALNKPTVFGGLVMFTSFIPSSDVCGLGGNSYVYAVYYKTGTAYTTAAIGSSGTLVYNRTQTASTGMASSIAIHSGRESGAQAFVQMSTGETTSLTTTPTTSIKSAVISWREL